MAKKEPAPHTVQTILDLINSSLSPAQKRNLCRKLTLQIGERITGLGQLLVGDEIKMETYNRGPASKKEKKQNRETLVKQYLDSGIKDARQIRDRLLIDAPGLAKVKDRSISLKTIKNIVAQLKRLTRPNP